MSEVFEGSFTQQDPIPREAIEAAIRVMESGRLHRYNVAEGEFSEAALLEQEFAELTGARYCVAVASGGSAMATALRAIGVRPGDKVLSNAFTLAPVPGAIASLGAVPVFVEVTEELTIDLADLETRIAASGARVLLLSHMRGHLCDMAALMTLCDRAGVTVIEDCAHTMGASWDGTASGRHGAMAAYSTQTYKHVNSGEGGFLTSDDEVLMARAILLSGSYMLFDRHLSKPAADVFEQVKYDTPNVSGRMDNLRAAILRPQLKTLQDQCDGWTERYREVESGLRDLAGLKVIERPEQERFVGSSIQFLLPGWRADQIRNLVARCLKRGVELKWFGAEEPAAFTSRYDSWHYANPEPMPKTDAVLAQLMDMRVPLTFSLQDCAQISRIIRSEVSALWQQG
jgi:dTDP-4-amino-4,6-dideoxygalactose transaminase